MLARKRCRKTPPEEENEIEEDDETHEENEEDDVDPTQIYSTTRIPGGVDTFPVKVPGHCKPPNAPASLFPLHFCSCMIGPPRSGKTTALICLIHRYMAEELFSRIFLISGTIHSNPEFAKLGLNLHPQNPDICQDLGQVWSFFDYIDQEMKSDVHGWKTQKEYEKIFKRWMNSNSRPEDIAILEANHYMDPHIPRQPSGILLVDDMSANELLSQKQTSRFANFIANHRHIGGQGCGVSVVINVHYITALPKKARRMFDTFHIFALADMSQIDAVYTECCNTTNKDQFHAIYKTAIAHDGGEDEREQSHHFLTIDPYNPELSKRFRKDFNRLIDYPQQDPDSASLSSRATNKRTRCQSRPRDRDRDKRTEKTHAAGGGL